MARITRRRVLKLSGAGVMAAQTAQGTNIHWVRWADFVPASDALLKAQIAQARFQLVRPFQNEGSAR